MSGYVKNVLISTFIIAYCILNLGQGDLTLLHKLPKLEIGLLDHMPQMSSVNLKFKATLRPNSSLGFRPIHVAVITLNML